LKILGFGPWGWPNHPQGPWGGRSHPLAEPRWPTTSYEVAGHPTFILFDFTFLLFDLNIFIFILKII
jgi:hypothetical protein